MVRGRICGECNVCEGRKPIPACEWLSGWGVTDDRPDKTGVIMDRVFQMGNLIGAITATPLQPGAENTQEGQSAICVASRVTGMPVIVVDSAGEKVLHVVGRGLE